MPIEFGRIKKAFVDRENLQSDVWIVASSGVYLLKRGNVASEFKQAHYKFLEDIYYSY